MTKYIWRILILLILLTNIGIKADERLSDLMSMPKDTNTINKLIKISNTTYPIDSNIRIANYAYTLSQKLNYKTGEAKALHSLGENFYLSADYEKALFYLHNELNILEENSNAGHKLELGECYRMLGEVSRAFREFETALAYLTKAEMIFKELDDKLSIAKTYNRFAAVILELSNFQKDKRTIEYLEKSDDIAKKYKFNDVIANNLNIYATYYSNTGDISKAIEMYKKALTYFEETGKFSERSNVLRNIADTYRFLKQKDSALAYAKMSYYEAKKNKVNIFIFEATRLLFYIYFQDFKNSDSAIVYLNESMEKQVHIYDEEKYRSQLQIQHKYNTQLKDKEIESQKKLILYQVIIFIAILIVLVITIFFFYYKSILQRKANEAISEQNEKLEELNIAKDKFFSIIAHDLKNPVGSFKLIADLLNDDYDDFKEDEKREFLLLMKESAGSLLNLLENLLTWSRSQRQNLPYSPEIYNLYDLTENVILMLKPLGLAKKINIRNEISTDVSAFFDINMIYSVLHNLISNAIKFSEADSDVIINAESILEENKDFIRIDVIDSGVGMVPEQMNTLFKLVENISTLGTRGERGSGLGLILVMDFIKKINSRIWVESEPGVGTAFHFILPKNKV